MKKIFFILPSIGFGGAEKVYIEVASALSKYNQYEVELLYLTRAEKERTIPKGLKTKCFNVSSTKASFCSVLRYIKQMKPDCIFSTLTHLNVMVIIMKKVYNLPFKLYVRHTYNLSNIFQNNALKREISLNLNKLYKYADGVIFQSNFMYDDFTKIIPLTNSHIIGNPINIKRMSKLANGFKPEFNVEKDQKRIFLFVGRLVQIKNVDYLIHSFNRFSNKGSSKLVIIGDGIEKEKLSKLIVSLKLQESVEILESKQNPYPYIKNCDALFLCSKSEGFPNVVIESLGLDTPIFVRKHPGGTEEVLKNLNLSKYFMDELDFNHINNLLEHYPRNLSEKTDVLYGIESIVRNYVYLIENEE